MAKFERCSAHHEAHDRGRDGVAVHARRDRAVLHDINNTNRVSNMQAELIRTQIGAAHAETAATRAAADNARTAHNKRRVQNTEHALERPLPQHKETQPEMTAKANDNTEQRTERTPMPAWYSISWLTSGRGKCSRCCCRCRARADTACVDKRPREDWGRESGFQGQSKVKPSQPIRSKRDLKEKLQQ